MEAKQTSAAIAKRRLFAVTRFDRLITSAPLRNGPEDWASCIGIQDAGLVMLIRAQGMAGRGSVLWKS